MKIYMYVYLRCMLIYICKSFGNLKQTFLIFILLLTHLTLKTANTQTYKCTHAHRYITHHIQIYLPPMAAHKFVSRIHCVWLGIMKFRGKHHQGRWISRFFISLMNRFWYTKWQLLLKFEFHTYFKVNCTYSSFASSTFWKFSFVFAVFITFLCTFFTSTLLNKKTLKF